MEIDGIRINRLLKEERQDTFNWLLDARFWMGYAVGNYLNKDGYIEPYHEIANNLYFSWYSNSRRTIIIRIGSESHKFASYMWMRIGNNDPFEHKTVCTRENVLIIGPMIEGLIKRFFPNIEQMNTWGMCDLKKGTECQYYNSDGLPVICYPVGLDLLCHNCNDLIDKTKLNQHGAGFVYLIGNKETGYFKIGLSSKPKSRLSQLKEKLPFPVKLIHQIFAEDMLEAERLLQSQFEDKHCNGEWYNLSQDDIDYICSLKELS